MRSLLCDLVCLMAAVCWFLAWLTLGWPFLLSFALIVIAVWLIALLLQRAARVLRRFLVALVMLAFGLLLIFNETFREFIRKLLDGLSTEGPHLFVWAIVFTIMCAICRSSRAARSSS